MNDGFVFSAVLVVVYLLGVLGGWAVGGMDKADTAPTHQLSCVSGPHPNNPQLMYLECEFKEVE